jgi:hypothetical protein
MALQVDICASHEHVTIISCLDWFEIIFTVH